MNTPKDFHKKTNGVVLNVNSHDYRRARNRNIVRRETASIIGDTGRVQKLESEVAELKSMLLEALKRK